MNKILLTNKFMLEQIQNLSFEMIGNVLYNEEFGDTLAKEIARDIVEGVSKVEEEPIVPDNYWNE